MVDDSGSETIQDLHATLQTLGIKDQQRLLMLQEYVDQVVKWNKHFNLVSRGDVYRLPRRHVLDSLSVLSCDGLLKAGRVLDIGSGAGLPGLVLAIARPDLEFTLLDRHSRKVRFVQQTITHLGLKNATGVEVDLSGDDTWSREHNRHFDHIVSRAVTGLADLWSLSSHLLKPDGWMLAYTATSMKDSLAPELNQLPEAVSAQGYGFDLYAQKPKLRRLIGEDSASVSNEDVDNHVIVQLRAHTPEVGG